MELENITKAATLKGFLHQSFKNAKLFLLRQWFLILLMRKTLNNGV